MDETEKPDFMLRKLTSYKDCLSRQVAEAILIHYSEDSLLNSKNEYNSNCLARVTVEETAYDRKKRERKEEEESLKEQKAWDSFKWSRGPGKRRQDYEVPHGWNGKDRKRPRLHNDEDQGLNMSPPLHRGGATGEIHG